MNPPVTDAQLSRARRNQAFTNAPMAMGQCALMAAEVALFPVRYALDESPLHKGNNQGPHPLPTGWSNTPPTLKTRSYTLRQLRDGWLYVYNSVDQTFHEYQVSGRLFTRHLWTDSQLNKDVRHNPGESHPYLLYPRRSQLRIAYSPVQWTWRLCELMRHSAPEQTRWMRSVDLSAFCASGTVAHGALITELGKSVADILTADGSAPTFASTLLPTQARDAEAPFKAAFDEALVRGNVPEQDTALFIALDDPLAMLDDLGMNLAGRLMEQSEFEATHQHALQSAFAVQNLCGFDTAAFIPASIKAPLQRQAYTDDLYTLLATHDDIERGKDLAGSAEGGLVDIGAMPTLSAAQAVFKTTWGHLPDREKWQVALEDWNAKRLWREDVRFDEVQTYLSQTTRDALRLQRHCQHSEQDLLTWLNQLDPNAEAIYHDTCNEAQASQLLETAHALYTLLGNGENGQAWLCEQAEQPTRLFGMALFNFNPEIAALIQQVTRNFSTTGKLDDQGREGDGSSPTLTLGASGDATSLGSRTSEIKAVLDLESVRTSKLYQTMSNAAQHSLTTLINIANHQAKDAWHGLSGMLLPAMKQQAALTLAVPQVLISTEISSSTQLTFNPTYPRDYQAWLMQLITVQKKITSAKAVLQRPGPAYDQRAARLSLQALEAQTKNLFLQRPNQITAKASGSTRLPASLPHINGWLTHLGQADVMAQLKVAGTYEYLTRTKAWMNQNLGSALPALLVGLNVWNTHHIAKQAQNDGRFTADELRTMGSSAAYAANAIAALWVGPAWNRAGGMSAKLGTETLKIAQAGYTEWVAAIASKKVGEATIASDFAAISKRLILRTVTWATFGAVAAGLEAWQISKDTANATSKEESILLWTKVGVVFLMGTVATAQLIGASFGYWQGFAWVMSTPITVALAVLGIGYLILSMAANRFKRDGLRLWLYRCNWGRGSTSQWLGDDGHPKQMQALLETLQRPSVGGRALYSGGGSTPRKWIGFWVQIQVPAVLMGKEVILQPALIKKKYVSHDKLQVVKSTVYEQFLNGNWIDPKMLGVLPTAPGRMNNRPADFHYSQTEQHRLWQVWIETPTQSPVLELEIRYPAGVLQRHDGRGYMFRIALDWTANEADRINDAFSGELKFEDSIVLIQKSTLLLTLAIPDQVRHKFEDV